MKLLDDAQVVTGQQIFEPKSKPPVNDEKALENIRACVRFDYPIFAPQPKREGTAIFVGGGSTARGFIEEIKARRDAGEYVYTSNNTHDWLVDQGVIPHACLLLDPKEVVKDYVKKVQPDTAYLISSCADPAVWESMKERGAKMMKIMVAYGMPDDQDMRLLQELYPHIGAKYYLPGGTMTGLRAMPFAVMLGFRKLDMYGFDSCFSSQEPRLLYEGTEEFRSKSTDHLVYQDNKGRFIIDEPEDGGFYYAYKKPRRENVQIVDFCGRHFLSSGVLIHQAMQITKWIDRMEAQLDIQVKGDSLSAWVLECHRKQIAEKKERIGDRRWTEPYGALMRQMHETPGSNFGIAGYTDIEWSARALISLIATLQRPVTVLDYGAGAGTYAEAVHKVLAWAKVTSYDPFHPKWRDNPDPEMHDAVNCCDVLEHVELECVENTLQYIADRTRFLACFSIGLDDAIKKLPDGRNAHITQKASKWWAEKLRKHFVIVDVAEAEDTVLFVCQPFDMDERIKADGAHERTDLGGRLYFSGKIGGK